MSLLFRSVTGPMQESWVPSIGPTADMSMWWSWSRRRSTSPGNAGLITSWYTCSASFNLDLSDEIRSPLCCCCSLWEQKNKKIKVLAAIVPETWHSSCFSLSLSLLRLLLCVSPLQYADTDNILTNPDTLNLMIAENKSVIAPMLDSQGAYSNYWCGITPQVSVTSRVIKWCVSRKVSQDFCGALKKRWGMLFIHELILCLFAVVVLPRRSSTGALLSLHTRAAMISLIGPYCRSLIKRFVRELPSFNYTWSL